MAHFAKINDGVVLSCIVVNNKNCGGGEFPDSEPSGKNFISSIGLDGDWIQTSYNKNFRGNFAGIGMSYNSIKDVFHGKKPYESWVLGDDGNWYAPTQKPEGNYYWDESTLAWVAQ
jgi:hypothetical protein